MLELSKNDGKHQATNLRNSVKLKNQRKSYLVFLNYFSSLKEVDGYLKEQVSGMERSPNP